MKNNQDLEKMQNYKIVKSNDLIQRSRFDLTLQEQKIILYLISKIKPEDMELKEHIFEIQDFCKMCGIDSTSGANYKYIKETLKNLRDKSIWLKLDNGKETTLSWLDYVTMEENSGAVEIKISERMKPYLLQIKKSYTSYELLYILAMKSQYSIRLYELLKSYEYQHTKNFDIEELKKMLLAENYDRYPDFKRKVLEIATREINKLSDLTIKYEPIKDGRRFAKIEFSMKIKKNLNDRMKMWANIDAVLNPDQMSLFEILS